MVKLLTSWDIKPGKEEEYFEFVVKEMVPTMIKLGMQPTEAWYTQWGEAPQILAGWVADDRETIERALASDNWEEISQKLFRFVDNFARKIVKAGGMFQL
ncbi:MAG: hypothetical protein EXR62_08095 [Chloroflexi bacterium]|nr:hypothetical protein [Chloroflexota bacterium]